MNRFKKELRKRGYKLEMDYPYLPCPIKKGSSIEIETVCVDSEKCMLSEWTNVFGWYHRVFTRSFEAIEIDYT